MLKRVKNPRLGRSKDAKKALLKGLAKSLFDKGSIKTSEARAKGARSFIQSLLRNSGNKAQDLRRIGSILGANRKQSAKVVALAESLGNGQSATRIIRLGKRAGDASSRVRLELLAKLSEKPKPEKTAKPKKSAKTKVTTK